MDSPRHGPGRDTPPITTIHRAAPDAPLEVGRLFLLAEQLLGHPGDIAGRLGALVAEISGQRAALQLRASRPAARRPAVSSSPLVPVRFGGRAYGHLALVPAAWCDSLPALPADEARLLARACGAVLHLLDCAGLLERMARHLPPGPTQPLTPRERQVLERMARGENPGTIAARLHIAKGTVERHLEHIYQKLHVHSFLDAVLAAHRAGLITCFTTSADPA